MGPQPDEALYQWFLSGEGKVSCGFRYLKNHPAEAVMKKPKPKRRITATRIPRAIVSMLPPWSFAVLCPAADAGEHSGMTIKTETLQGPHYAYRFRVKYPKGGR
jgi:hypothetical protein